MSKQKPKPIDRAFAEKYKVNGKPLKPWTPERIIVAQELGMVQPNLTREAWAQWRRTQLYPSAIRDTIVFVYLSTLEDGAVDSATYADAKKLGIKLGLHKSGSQEFWDAYLTFLAVLNDQEASATKPKRRDDDEEDESGND